MIYRKILKQYWGFDDFRGIQSEIVNSISNGKDTLGLMPTGGGKSITFQVPALCKEGICIVVTPLIALMKDQVNNLRNLGIKAAAIYSGMDRNQIVVTLENCIFGDYKFLYISPERLSSELFLTKLERMKVSIVTIDEAHCISQWGYDFRPAYLNITNIRKLLPGVPVLALTATATPKVVKDIQDKLGFACENVIRMSFARENLAYVVRKTDNKIDELIHILDKVPGSAIVYSRNRRDSVETAKTLKGSGISADYYHAGLDSARRDAIQQAWSHDQIRVIVATNAFGMGIDKPDVRIVAHMNMPDSPEAYFQEAGRAGRDGIPSYAVLLFSPGDKRVINKRVSDHFPEKEFISKVYDKLSYYFQMAMGDGKGCKFPFSLSEFCQQFQLPLIQTDSALRILTRMGYIEYIDEMEYAAKLLFTTKRDELYRLRNSDNITEQIVHVILRLHSGVFTDYVPIDEKLICSKSGVDQNTLYQTLKYLDKIGVVKYVPLKRTPLIEWSRARVDSSKLRFDPEVYELRKQEYKGRIKSMNEYVSRENGCRSEILLQYFGEKNSMPCLRCDLCLQKHDSGLSESVYKVIRDDVKKLLKNSPAEPAELYRLPYGKEQLNIALRHMLNEEILCMKYEMVYLQKSDD